MDLRSYNGTLDLALAFLRKDHPEPGLALVTGKASPERGAVHQGGAGVGDLGRLAARDGLALGGDARPGAALRAQPRRVPPQDVAGVAVVRGQRAREARNRD